MAGLEASYLMAFEEAARNLAVSSRSTKHEERKMDVCDGAGMQLALVTPPQSSPRIKTRGIVRSYVEFLDLDGSSGAPSNGYGKTAWNQRDTLDLIDAVKTVEDSQLLSNPYGKLSRTGHRTFKGNKWKQVAELLPNCWMSSSDRFNLICRGKFQELRRTYQAMLRSNARNESGRRFFFTDEVCQKMKDYIDEVPPLHFFDGLEGSKGPPLMIDSGCNSPLPKTKCMEVIKSPKGSEVGNSRKLKSNCSESGQRQQVRRSSRVTKRSCRLESSSEQVEMVVSPPKFTSPESRSSRTSTTTTHTTPPRTTPSQEKKQRSLRKQARAKALEDHEEQVETISNLFKKNFDLLRSNIDFSTEYHLHKHLHKHFKVFEDHMTGLIDKIDKKIDRLDQKLEERMGSLNLPF